MDLELRKIEEVKEVVDLKLWSINRGKYYATVRVRMQKGMGSWRVRRVFTLRGIECAVDA
jgi:Co/Zn/Cd efflux system component